MEADEFMLIKDPEMIKNTKEKMLEIQVNKLKQKTDDFDKKVQSKNDQAI